VRTLHARIHNLLDFLGDTNRADSTFSEGIVGHTIILSYRLSRDTCLHYVYTQGKVEFYRRYPNVYLTTMLNPVWGRHLKEICARTFYAQVLPLSVFTLGKRLTLSVF